MPTKLDNIILSPKQLLFDNAKISAFNNNYYDFSAIVPLDGDFAEIEVDGIIYILQPNKDGLFSYNTYEYSRELFSYQDSFDYTTTVLADINQSITKIFNIKIVLLDAVEELSTLTLTFFNGSKQRWESPFVIDGVVNFSENVGMPYYVGYPFEYSLVLNNDVQRILVDNGSSSGVDSEIRTIQKDCGGIYLKWHNSNFGYSYYLLERIGKEKFSTKSLGNVSEHFSWTDNELDIGKKGQRKLSLFSKVEYVDRELIKSLQKSNEVYLYTGQMGDVATKDNWLEVKISNSKLTETNKDSVFDFLVIVDLPQEKMRTRI